jgi:hypothetical protein
MILAILATAGVAAPLMLGCDDLPACGDGSEPDQLICPGGQDGGGSDAAPSCVPGEGGPPGADCGVFVSSSNGSDTNGGSPDAPKKTLANAVARAAAIQKPVYACAEDLPVTMTLEVPAGTVIYGGLDCDGGWGVAQGSKRTVVRAPSDGVLPMRLKAGVGATELHRMHIEAGDGIAPGGSSIAVIVEDVKATLVDCTIQTADAADGEPGSTPGMGPSASGQDGMPGNEACGAPAVSGGPGGMTGCDDGQTGGGTGGEGSEFLGKAGENGTPVGGQAGGGGLGENFQACKAGGAGKDGAPGTPGVNATGIGTIDLNGYTGVSGGDATQGARGNGGGGGGGSKGGTAANKCQDANNGGASGGGGGAGGCGGGGGRGGGPGGSSIGIVSLGATKDTRLTLMRVTLSVGRAGAGGAGGLGQVGGPGGLGGNGGTVPPGATLLKSGCKGGNGGKGGDGGDGGDGLHGHSIGVAFTGDPPAKIDVVLEPASSPVGESVEQRQFN